jgi:signal peptidase II
VLHYLENKGAAFGIMQERQILFYVATVVILVVMAVIFWKLPLKKRFLPLYIIVILIFAGALGNFIDRVIQQYVVDFFYFKLINFPIFNVADIYVTGAAIAFIVLLLFYYKEEDFNEIFHGSRN